METDKTPAKRGRPFGKGNPGGPGRPKTDPEIKAMFKAATPRAAEFLVKVIADTKARVGDRIKAAEVIIDHGLGKAAQEISITGDSKLVISFDPILKEELDPANK